MSSHNLRVILSDEAKADVVDILQYTYDTWGNAQMNFYSTLIEKALSTMSEHPHLGKKAPEISEQHRAMKAGQHIIFYTVMDNTIHISRILHSKMDIKNSF